MSNARSPREVCSITIGINGLISRLLASGGPQLRLGSGRSFFRRPQLLAGAGELERDPLDLGDDQVQRLAHPQVLAEQLVRVRSANTLLDRPRPRRRPRPRACSRTNSRSSSSVTSMPALSATASSASSRATDRAASARRRSSSCCGRLVRDREVGLRRDPAALERLDEPVEELARARLDERAGRLDVRRLDERVGGGGAELRLGLLLDLLARCAARGRRAARRACRTRSPRGRARRRAAAGSSPSRP